MIPMRRRLDSASVWISTIACLSCKAKAQAPMQSSRKWDTDAVWIPEVDTDLDAETAQLRKHIDFNDCVHVLLEAIVKD